MARIILQFLYGHSVRADKKGWGFCLVAFFGLPFLSFMIYHSLKEQWDVSVMESHEGRIPGG